MPVFAPDPLSSLAHSIDAILAQDVDAPPKQRYTAMQVFRQLGGL
jgi:hypothetical protein